MTKYSFIRTSYLASLTTVLMALIWVALQPPSAQGGAMNTPTQLENLATLPVGLADETHVYLPLIQSSPEISDSTPQRPPLLSLSLQSGATTTNTVINGETITYTIQIKNPNNRHITITSLEDILPETGLTNIQCGGCTIISDSKKYEDPIGDQFEVTTTTKLTWSSLTLTSSQTKTYSFTAQVSGQNNAAMLNNRAILIFKDANNQAGLIDSSLLATVRVQIKTPAQLGLSAAPSWLSDEPAAATGFDWGDFDKDGDLDLALATTFQVSVYRNEAGQLRQFWNKPLKTLDVKWIQPAENKPLALIAVGETVDHKGQFVIYTWNKEIIVGEDIFGAQIFSFDYPLARVAVANFDNQTSLDVAVSSLNFNTPCSVWLITDTAKLTEPSLSNISCISNNRVLAMNVVDIGNSTSTVANGTPDLALGVFPNQIKVLLNQNPSTPLSDTQSLEVAPTDIGLAPYDIAWGDVNKDGLFDAAVAYPLLGEIRIYSNTGSGFALQPPILKAKALQTAYALDWGDFNNDALLDLAAVGTNPLIFYNTGILTQPFADTPSLVLSIDSDPGRVWSVRGVDTNNDGTLELGVASRDHQSLLLPNFSLPLRKMPTNLFNMKKLPATAITWGDINNDGFQDLLFGAGSPQSAVAEALDAKLFINSKQSFVTKHQPFLNSGVGPHLIATADSMNKDGKLEITFATANQIQIYAGGDTSLINPIWRKDIPAIKAIAWGDLNGDGWLDLAVASISGVQLFLNNRGNLSTTPMLISPLSTVTALAWGDFNNDHFLDLAASSVSEPVHIFLNRFGHHFELFSLSSSTQNASTIAQADFNGDSLLDIAVATDKNKIVLFANTGNITTPTFLALPDLVGTNTSPIRSLAWADADNDKDLDLAVAYDLGSVQIFTNLSGNLIRAWESADAYTRAQVAWGDADRDGDLDLGFSQDDGQKASGYFENRYIFSEKLLPNQPSSLWIAAPDGTGGSTSYAASRILSGPQFNTVTQRFVGKPVTITFQFTATSLSDAEYEVQKAALYEYSLDGGDLWLRATASTTPTVVMTDGNEYTGQFIWDAFRDRVISDDARFRVQLPHPLLNIGRTQRASVSASSTTFRVRSVSCLWPTNPQFSIVSIEKLKETPPKVDLFGSFDPTAGGGGKLKFEWYLQGNTFVTHTLSAVGQRVTLPITYTNVTTATLDEVFTIALTVTGEACPVVRPVIATGAVSVTLPGKKTVLNAAQTVENQPLPQVFGLTGTFYPESGSTSLRWDAPPTEVAATGYRLYVASNDQSDFQLLATVPVNITDYQDNQSACSKVYYVSTFNEAAESSASTESFYTPDCVQ